LKLADARMLVENLPSGDVWDQDEFGHQYPTRSSYELSHLQRLLRWTTRGWLLEVDGDVLVPLPGTAELVHDLPELAGVLTRALPEVASEDRAGFWAEPRDLDLALATVWQVLGAPDGPVGQRAVCGAVWDELTDYGEDPFQDPAGAEDALRRATGRLIVLCEDLGLVHRPGEDLLELTEAGRRAPWAQDGNWSQDRG